VDLAYLTQSLSLNALIGIRVHLCSSFLPDVLGAASADCGSRKFGNASFQRVALDCSEPQSIFSNPMIGEKLKYPTCVPACVWRDKLCRKTHDQFSESRVENDRTTAKRNVQNAFPRTLFTRRDVRSDDAVHRPQRLPQSCLHSPVGWDVCPPCPFEDSSACGSDGSNR